MAKLIIGCGYLGHRVSLRWRANDEPIFVTTRSPLRAEEFRQRGLGPILCDVLDAASLSRLPHVATVLYAVGPDRASGKSLREVYVNGLDQVLRALPTPRRFLYVSSTSVYGQSHGEEVDETAATEPLEESGRVMLEAERLLRDRLPEAIVLRFAGIYGPGRLLLSRQLQAGAPIVGDADRWLNLIQVEDGVTAILAAESRGVPGGIYHVCDDQPVRRQEFYSLLARLLDVPPPHFVSPSEHALPKHAQANRRILNHRLRKELDVALLYPSYAEGLPGSIMEEDSDRL